MSPFKDQALQLHVFLNYCFFSISLMFIGCTPYHQHQGCNRCPSATIFKVIKCQHLHPTFKSTRIIISVSKCQTAIICVWVPSSCHLTMSSASSGLQDHTKGIKGIIKGIIKGSRSLSMTISSSSSVQELLTFKPSSVSPRASSRLLHEARGFMGFFNHLNRTRGPPWVKISSVEMLGLLLGYHDIIIA